MTIIKTDRGQIIKTIGTPEWNEFHRRWYVSGHRYIKTRKTFSTLCYRWNFESFKSPWAIDDAKHIY